MRQQDADDKTVSIKKALKLEGKYKEINLELDPDCAYNSQTANKC